MSEDENVISMIGEQFRRLNLRFDKLDEKMEKLEQRLGNVERRLTASTHFEQSVLAHLASVHESIDNLRADLVGIDRRVGTMEGR